MRRKGVSPVIATIILVVMAVALAVGIILLMGGFTPKNDQDTPSFMILGLGQSTQTNVLSWYYTGMPDNIHGTLGCHVRGYGGGGFTLWFTLDSTLNLGGTSYTVIELTEQYVILQTSDVTQEVDGKL